MVLEPTALYANNSSNAKGYQGQTYHGGNQQGHQGSNHGRYGGKGGNPKKERPICTYCGVVGHIADKCYKLHAYPPGYRPKGKSSANQVSSARNFGNFSPNLGSFGNFSSQALSGFPNQVEMMNCSP